MGRRQQTLSHSKHHDRNVDTVLAALDRLARQALDLRVLTEALTAQIAETRELARQLVIDGADERIPLPSRPPPSPPEPTSPTAIELSPAPAAPTLPTSSSESSTDDLASLIERHSWDSVATPPVESVEHEDDSVNSSWTEETGLRRSPKQRPRSVIPAAKFRKSAPPPKGEGSWEQDLSSLLDRGAVPAHDADDREAPGADDGRPLATGKNTLENLLTGYLKDKK